MNKTKLSIIALGIAGVATLVWRGYSSIHEQIIVDRFPQYDPKYVRACYKEMFRDVLRGHTSIDGLSETEIDEIFKNKYLDLKK